MSTWSGWEDQFLKVAGLPTTAANRRFLDEWAAHAETNCTNNPIDLTHKLSGSTNCGSLPALTLKTQHYTSHAQAAQAFLAEIDGTNLRQLRAALESGDPFTVNNTGVVSEQIDFWGSTTFAKFYFNETGSAPGRGGSSSQFEDSHALAGWADIRHSVNHNMPAALRSSQKMTAAALRRVGRARKVGR